MVAKKKVTTKPELISFVITCPQKGRVVVPLGEVRLVLYFGDIFDNLEINFDCPCGQRHSVDVQVGN